MNDIRTIWHRLGNGARISLAVVAVLVLVGALAAGIAVTQTHYEVLFSGLSTRESAAVVAALEREKIPYQLGDEEGTIRVVAEKVHKTRLKLMSSELPVQGSVGFELFNNNDVGMTDFAQKINYQRALQGELTRTIMALDEVQSARVHLALPEQGLFRRAAAPTQPKASVTLTLKPGWELKREQTRGIQRLVAAAVPDVRPEDVTVLDQRGVALTAERAADGDHAVPGGVDGKRDAEDYLTRKLRDVLDQTFGPGQSIARIDVVLNQDQSRVTTESVLPANVSVGQRPAGVVVREMETGEREGGGTAGGTASTTDAGNARSREVQYQVGRRVEQIVSAPGGVQRINVAVVVRRSLDGKQTEKLKELVGAAIGFDRLRGDSIAIQSIDQILGAPQVADPVLGKNASSGTPSNTSSKVPDTAEISTRVTAKASDSLMSRAVIVMVLLLAGTVAVAVWGLRRRSIGNGRQTVTPLTAARREAVLRDVQQWLAADAQASASKP